jgi:hypothetical protein
MSCPGAKYFLKCALRARFFTSRRPCCNCYDFWNSLKIAVILPVGIPCMLCSDWSNFRSWQFHWQEQSNLAVFLWRLSTLLQFNPSSVFTFLWIISKKNHTIKGNTHKKCEYFTSTTSILFSEFVCVLVRTHSSGDTVVPLERTIYEKQKLFQIFLFYAFLRHVEAIKFPIVNRLT